MSQNLRPEEQLKEARERARELLSELGEAAGQEGWRPGEKLLGVDHLSLFLRSLNAELLSALDEARASSRRLADLSAELRRATAHRERQH
jgi:hypothetical protein